MTTTPTAIRIADIKFVMGVDFDGFCGMNHRPSKDIAQAAREYDNARSDFERGLARPTVARWHRYVRAARRWHRMRRTYSCRTCVARQEREDSAAAPITT